jgi:hypothetical protein
MEGKISIFHVTNMYFCVSQYVNYINILISQCLKGLMYIEMPFFFFCSVIEMPFYATQVRKFTNLHYLRLTQRVKVSICLIPTK